VDEATRELVERIRKEAFNHRAIGRVFSADVDMAAADTIEALTRDAGRLRTALTAHVEFFGGRDHHKDDCPGNCRSCQVCDLADAALAPAKETT
jgi:hypothetical protein